jgi:hypothetical protein
MSLDLGCSVCGEVHGCNHNADEYIRDERMNQHTDEIREAFEKILADYGADDSQGRLCAELTKATASADAEWRAMQGAFEQVCEKANHVAVLHMCEQEGISSGMPTPQEWMDAAGALHEALSLAAPFRKTGV